MTLSARQTSSATAVLRGLLAEWDAEHAASTPGDRDREKDVVLAFRTRPPLDSDYVPAAEPTDDDGEPVDDAFLRGITVLGDTVVAHVPATSWKGHSLQHKVFAADLCFGPDASQDTVYAEAMDDYNMVELALNGGLACVLAYGQTGSGKTHTIGGLEERIASDIFDKAESIGARFKSAHGDASAEPVFAFHVTFLELLGKNAYDLSTPPADPDDEALERKKVAIMEDKLGDVRPQLKSTVVRTPDELQTLITRCLAHRRTTPTAKNPRSSRSHAVLSIRAENRLLPQLDAGQLVLVDLAGSERYDDAKHHSRQLMDESRETNKSLMALKDCVRARARAAESGAFVHVPYRANRLTLLLKALFDLDTRQRTRTLIIAHVSPHMRDAHHSANTLAYAAPFRAAAPAVHLTQEVDEADPRTWDNAFARAWLEKGFRVELGKLTPARKTLAEGTPLPFDLALFLPPPLGGLHLCRLYSAAWIESLPPATIPRERLEKAAFQVYVTFCERLRVARTKGRWDVLKTDQEAREGYMQRVRAAATE